MTTTTDTQSTKDLVKISSALYVPKSDFEWFLGVYQQDGMETALLTAKARFLYMSKTMLEGMSKALEAAAANFTFSEE